MGSDFLLGCCGGDSEQLAWQYLLVHLQEVEDVAIVREVLACLLRLLSLISAKMDEWFD